jgi:hypothetical protein
VKRSVTPTFKPKIAPKSATMVNHSNNSSSNRKPADFLTRVEKDLLRRESGEQTQNILLQELEDCTFKPKINKKAETLRSRSTFELSYGDKLRQDTKLKMLKLQSEQAELADATFKPKISSKAQEIGKSKLQLQRDPAKFLEWANRKKEELELLRQEELKRREEEELRDCTFEPQTTKCPAYIKRIAESISKMKSARGNQSTSTVNKPDWK